MMLYSTPSILLLLAIIWLKMLLRTTSLQYDTVSFCLTSVSKYTDEDSL
jgi:hypothetical protein